MKPAKNAQSLTTPHLPRLTPEEDGLYARLAEIDATIVDNARHFSIHEAGLDRFIAALPQLPEEMLHSDAYHFVDRNDLERTLNYLFCVEAIDFGGPYAPELRAEGSIRPGLDIYHVIAMRLKSAFERQEDLSATAMANMTSGQIGDILAFNMDGEISAAIVDMFAQSVREVGSFINHRFNGSFSACLNAAGGSVERFVGTLLDIPSLYDVHDYRLRNGQITQAPILKRVQHLASCISLTWQHMGRTCPFDDREKITAFPDNKLAHVLRVEGILKPGPELEDRIANGIRIGANSGEEIECRICSRHIVREMARRTGILQSRLDHWIWESSHGMSPLLECAYDDFPQLLIERPTFNY